VLPGRRLGEGLTPGVECVPGVAVEFGEGAGLAACGGGSWLAGGVADAPRPANVVANPTAATTASAAAAPTMTHPGKVVRSGPGSVLAVTRLTPLKQCIYVSNRIIPDF
jgi:hypothetical protein